MKRFKVENAIATRSIKKDKNRYKPIETVPPQVSPTSQAPATPTNEIPNRRIDEITESPREQISQPREAVLRQTQVEEINPFQESENEAENITFDN